MKVKINQTIEKEVDITFPIYFCEHLDFHKICYGKIDGYTIEKITIKDNIHVKIHDAKIEKYEISDLTYFLDYIYNRSYNLNQTGFYNMKDKVIKFLNSF